MIEFLNNLDTSVFLAINGPHSPFFDNFMTMFTGRFIWIPMYAMVLWIFFKSCRWQAAIVYLLALIAAICLTDQTCASLIRPLVERLRPSNLDNPISEVTYIVDNYRGGNYGFPSCHAANSFALAVFLATFVKRRSFTIFIIGWALLNSYTRLYIGVHYPGDLLVGALVGSAYGLLCHQTASLLTTHIFYSVKLLQLTPGVPLTTLSPIDATLLQPMPPASHSAPNLMIATFALTLTIIIITSAL